MNYTAIVDQTDESHHPTSFMAKYIWSQEH